VAAFEEVWFAGQIEAKRPCEAYSDQHGNYNARPGDHLFYRYEVQRAIGKGSFGQVYRAFDHKSKETVAIKITRNRPRYSQQALH
jgi:dual specificity tyrosine-phosphorylation-regulated kinase 2/3/4